MLEKPVGVLVVEEDLEIREALRAAIVSNPIFQLMAMCASRREALQVIRETPLDVVLVSLRLPDGSGLAVIEAARKFQPSSEVLVMGTAADKQDLYSSIDAGASACLLKEQLVRNRTAFGNTIIASLLFSRTLAHASPARRETGSRKLDAARLSAVQTDILSCLASGATNKEIARHLHLTSYNVDYHMKRLRKRFSARNRVQLIGAAKAFFDS